MFISTFSYFTMISHSPLASIGLTNFCQVDLSPFAVVKFVVTFIERLSFAFILNYYLHFVRFPQANETYSCHSTLKV